MKIGQTGKRKWKTELDLNDNIMHYFWILQLAYLNVCMYIKLSIHTRFTVPVTVLTFPVMMLNLLSRNLSAK